VPVTGTVYTGTSIAACSRESFYAQGFSPFGMRLNLRPSSRLQPTFSSHEGYIFSTQPLPLANAGSFNFAFEFGAGLEYYRTQHSSMRFEYLIQHYSNHNTADANPGVDTGLFKLSYTFGR
jgi:opacity protein-like surface antigen